MKSTSYFRTIEKRIYIDVNAATRKAPEDAIILRPLEAAEVHLYNDLRRANRTEAEIYEEISKPQYDERVAILESSRALKGQLTQNISLRVGEPLPTLERMSTDDLTKLLLALIRKQPTL